MGIISRKFVLIVFLGVLLLQSIAIARIEYFIATDGNDSNPGTINSPFATLGKARDAIRALKNSQGLPDGGIIVFLRGGRYFLADTFILMPEDSGTEEAPIIYPAYCNEDVTISGGRQITGWIHQGLNLWSVQLPEVAAGTWYFRQFFADGQRLTRARTPNSGYYFTQGPLTKYAGQIQHNYSWVSSMRVQEPEMFCGFEFAAGNIGNWADVNQAEIITFHSWECSWQTVKSIDFNSNDIYFNTPCRYPVGFFSNNCRYRVENVIAALDEPGEWYLNRGDGTLKYLAKDGENPNEMDFVAPVLEKPLILQGDPNTGEFVEYITFSGLSFKHAKYPMGIYDIYPDWPQQAINAYGSWPTVFLPGYTDAQAAPLCGQAIELEDARHCTFENCKISQIGNYAIKIGERCHINKVAGCEIYDAGGGYDDRHTG